MPAVQSQIVNAALWAQRPIHLTKDTKPTRDGAAEFETDVYMVELTKPNPEYRTTQVRAKQGSPMVAELVRHHGLQGNEIESSNKAKAFCRGRPLLEPCIEIKTCGEVGPRLPPFLYRSSHSGHPGNGRQARGYGKRNPTGLYRQIYFQDHLNDDCRERKPSPCVSWTDDPSKAISFAARFHRLGYQGIKIEQIRTDGPEWDHSTQKIRDAQYLEKMFRLNKNKYVTREYLIEGTVPDEAVVATWDWDDICSANRNQMITAERARLREMAHKAMKAEEKLKKKTDHGTEVKRKWREKKKKEAAAATGKEGEPDSEPPRKRLRTDFNITIHPVASGLFLKYK